MYRANVQKIFLPKTSPERSVGIIVGMTVAHPMQANLLFGLIVCVSRMRAYGR